MILFDTDVCIEILRGNKKILKKGFEYPGGIAVSFMSVAELFYGAENSRYPVENRTAVEMFMMSLVVIQSDVAILRRFGELKAELGKQHKLIPDADMLIAATALEKSEALVTGNAKHFERVRGLRVENWIR